MKKLPQKRTTVSTVRTEGSYHLCYTKGEKQYTQFSRNIMWKLKKNSTGKPLVVCGVPYIIYTVVKKSKNAKLTALSLCSEASADCTCFCCDWAESENVRRCGE